MKWELQDDDGVIPVRVLWVGDRILTFSEDGKRLIADHPNPFKDGKKPYVEWAPPKEST